MPPPTCRWKFFNNFRLDILLFVKVFDLNFSLEAFQNCRVSYYKASVIRNRLVVFIEIPTKYLFYLITSILKAEIEIHFKSKKKYILKYESIHKNKHVSFFISSALVQLGSRSFYKPIALIWTSNTNGILLAFQNVHYHLKLFMVIVSGLHRFTSCAKYLKNFIAKFLNEKTGDSPEKKKKISILYRISFFGSSFQLLV